MTIRNAVDRLPLLKRFLRPVYHLFRPSPGVSHSYEELADGVRESEASKLRSSWQDEVLPKTQRALVNKQIAIFRAGRSVPVFDIMTDAVGKMLADRATSSLLEIGCSSGYYSEVFDIARLDVDYSGCDYSPAFIDMARVRYPERRFTVADATALPYADEAFDIALSGCCLLHIPEYERAIEETARVTRKYAIFHRTPVIVGGDTKYFTKKAYNIETIEIHLSETVFYKLLRRSGLSVEKVYTIGESVIDGKGTANRTYVCVKNTNELTN